MTTEDSRYEAINKTQLDRPAPRYGHAACQIGAKFAVFGGKLSSGVLSNELWVYDVVVKKWSLRAENSIVSPPALTRHTLTAVNDELYLFGGSTSDGEFSSRYVLLFSVI